MQASWMKGLTILLALFVVQTTSAAAAQSNPVYVLVYGEARPGHMAQVHRLLSRYQANARREGGFVSIDAYSQRSNPNAFLLIECWGDEASLQGHGTSAPSVSYLKELKLVTVAPLDVRPHTLYVEQHTDPARSGATLEVVHVDVQPSAVDALVKILDAYADNARAEPNLVSIVILRGLTPRSNHFSVVERWRSLADEARHKQRQAAITYRENLAPLLGALYDARSFEPMGK